MKSLYDEDVNILLQDLLICSKVRKTAAEEYFAKNHTSMSMTGGEAGGAGKEHSAFKGFSKLFIAPPGSPCHAFLHLACKWSW